MESLAASDYELRFPSEEVPPRIPLSKPCRGRYHVVRFIRSDAILDIFSEKFKVPPEAVYEYVQASIDVGKQRLRILLDGKTIDEKKYTMR